MLVFTGIEYTSEPGGNDVPRPAMFGLCILKTSDAVLVLYDLHSTDIGCSVIVHTGIGIAGTIRRQNSRHSASRVPLSRVSDLLLQTVDVLDGSSTAAARAPGEA